MAEQEDATQDQGTVLLEQVGTVATLTLSRPDVLNALTLEMYQQLEEHLHTLEDDEQTRVVVLRGAGKAFAAGTDIPYFQGFTAEDGLAYEQIMEAIIERLYLFPKPTLAAVHGYAVGAGILLASVCDLRYASTSARFGLPIGRTLGNCLSIKNYRHVAEAFGTMRTKEMLFTGRLLSAEDALHCNYLTALVDEEQLFPHVLDIAQQISTMAPLTILGTKEAHRRLSKEQTEPAFDDILTRMYASSDFAEGVRAYNEKRKPLWTGK